jgi:hypothetical protein
MENPQMSGYDIGEKISGIARENWGEPVGRPMMGGSWSYSPCMRGGLIKHVIDGKEYVFPTAKQTTPYYLADDCTIALEGQGTLRSIVINNFKETFCLTPALTSKIIGEPSSISLVSKGCLTLNYDIPPKQYVIRINFCESSKKSNTKNNKFTTEITTNNTEFTKIFEEKKNAFAAVIYIYSAK